ncbi:MAG TPA: efflux RND transporter periplasmic adaptor subunit [Thermoanaerobaculia bacterium]|nr:efflux RND transporter periplasmic adaptor subunit [Thermoanaerobaculia bacterium]
MKRRVLIAAAIVLAILTVGAVRSKIAASHAGEWVKVRKDDLILGVDVTGELESSSSSSLGPPIVPDVWDFKISMLVPEGTDVKHGQPVLAFDTSELNRRLQEFRAEADSAAKEIEKTRADLQVAQKDEQLKLDDAEAKTRKAELKLDAPPDLVGRNERKQTEIERESLRKEIRIRRSKLASMKTSTQEKLQLLESKLASARTRVASIETSIARLTAVAPRDGTVVYCVNWRNEKKKVGDSTWAGERVIEIPDLARMSARGEVDESDAGRVFVGQRATIRLDAHPDNEYHGRVMSVGQTVQRARGSKKALKVMTVSIKLDRSDPAMMRPGMRFQGMIETNRVAGATVVPVEALQIEGQSLTVVRRTPFGMETKLVTIGRRNGEVAEVLRGLSPGDEVVRQQATKESAE